MKHVFFITAFLAMAWASALMAQQQEPPEPANPVFKPEAGMSWEIVVSRKSAPNRPQLKISGQKGERIRRDVARDASGSYEWYTIGSRVFKLHAPTGRTLEMNLRDDDHDSALSWYVSGFPGVTWVTPGMKGEVEFNKKAGRWLHVIEQKPSEWVRIGEGESSIMRPTGPSVPVTAYFDAQTGLPLRAEVDDKVYVYNVRKTGGGDPELPQALRDEIEKKLQRESALAEAIRRQESGN